MTTETISSTPIAQTAIKGQRVFTAGHSFHEWVAPILAKMAQAAGIAGHEIVGVSPIGGSRVIQHWDVSDAENKAKQALIAGQVDVLTLSPIWLPDEGIDNFAALAAQHNANVRVTVQEYWLPNDTYHPVYPLEVHVVVDHDAATIPDLKKWHDLYFHDMDEYVRGVNQKLGKQVGFIVPSGQAVLGLREKIIAGQAPGLNAQRELFFDSWGHPTPPIKVLATYCHFAAIYRRTPVGLPVPQELRTSLTEVGEPVFIAETHLDNLNLLLQQLAWEAVIHHPLSGVSSNATSTITSI